MAKDSEEKSSEEKLHKDDLDKQDLGNNIYTKFITSTEPKLEELQSVYVDDDADKMDKPKTAKETIGAALGGIRDDSRRFYKFVKRVIRRRRKDKPTEVQVISIVPDDFDTTWASRQASSAISRSSVDSSTSTDSCASSKDCSLQVVHDMEDDFFLDS